MILLALILLQEPFPIEIEARYPFGVDEVIKPTIGTCPVVVMIKNKTIESLDVELKVQAGSADYTLSRKIKLGPKAVKRVFLYPSAVPNAIYVTCKGKRKQLRLYGTVKQLTYRNKGLGILILS